MRMSCHGGDCETFTNHCIEVKESKRKNIMAEKRKAVKIVLTILLNRSGRKRKEILNM